MSVLVLINPHASGVRRRRGLTERLAARAGHRAELLVTRDLDHLERCLDRVVLRPPHLVAIVGGDGTIHHTLTRLATRLGDAPLPTVALLGGGTMNTLARNLDGVGAPERRLAALLDASAQPLQTRPHALLSVNGRLGSMFAAAMGSRFLEAYYGSGHPGLLTASLLAARTVGSALLGGPFAQALFAPLRTRLTLDEEPPVELDLRLLLAGTLQDFGLGMRIAWRASPDELRPQLVASGLPMHRLALQLPRVLTAQPLVGAPHLDRLFGRCSIEFDSAEPYTVDGELFRAQRLEVTRGPRLQVATLTSRR
jgi:diacylglycerol kinase family enzyme